MPIISPSSVASGGGAATLISNQLLSGSAASIDFTAIPATFNHLQIIGYARGDNAATQTVTLRFNNDSTANYDHQFLQGSAAAATVGEGLGLTGIGIGNAPGTGATANYFSVFNVTVPYYLGTTGDKLVIGTFFHKTGNATTNMAVGMFNGGWRTVGTAINRVTIFLGAGNLVTGSAVALYGLT